MKYAIKEINDDDGVPYVSELDPNRECFWQYSGSVDNAYKFASLDDAIAAIVRRAKNDGQMRNGFTVVGVEEVLKPAFTEVVL